MFFERVFVISLVIESSNDPFWPWSLLGEIEDKFELRLPGDSGASGCPLEQYGMISGEELRELIYSFELSGDELFFFSDSGDSFFFDFVFASLLKYL